MHRWWYLFTSLGLRCPRSLSSGHALNARLNSTSPGAPGRWRPEFVCPMTEIGTPNEMCRPEYLTRSSPTSRLPTAPRQSGHLGHTQVGERQLEVALAEHLCSYFLAARGSDPVQLVSVPLPRFDAIEGRRGHATTGRSVDQQTGTAKSLELLECGQQSHSAEIDAPVDRIRADLDPRGSDTGAATPGACCAGRALRGVPDFRSKWALMVEIRRQTDIR
jgi:hypothetical protein